jgi:Ca2+-binding EF-hand superfamily protein
MYRTGIALTLVSLCVVAGFAGPADDKAQKQKVPPAFAKLIQGSPEDFIKRFDKNKDGYLTKDELPPRLERLFDRVDANGDGKLDKKEVAQMQAILRRQLGLEAEKKPANPQQVERIVANLLQRMDTNKDGKISRDEAKGPLAKNFDLLDTNKDGYLDKAELRRAAERMLAAGAGGPGQGATPPNIPAKPVPDFDALDHNADGRLTRDELKGTPFADKFDQIDTNKDGKIDRKEFLAYLKKEAEKTLKKEADKK